jgi:hypothetical protein
VLLFDGHHEHWRLKTLARQVEQLIPFPVKLAHVGGGGGTGGATHLYISGFPPHPEIGAQVPWTKVEFGG